MMSMSFLSRRPSSHLGLSAGTGANGSALPALHRGDPSLTVA
jgi:hypothetical protein